MFTAHNHSKFSSASGHVSKLMLGGILLFGTWLTAANAELTPFSEKSPPSRSRVVLPTDNPTSEYGHYSFSLNELGISKPIQLRSVFGQSFLPFSLRSDEIITDAKLKLSYAWSPALIPELSHLKVVLNDELMESLPLSHENNNKAVREVRLDTSLIVDFNHLGLETSAHYTRDCEDPMHSSLWVNVSNESKLELTVRRLQLPNELSLLPAPFFDRFDKRKLDLPFIFFSQPNSEMLQAAGIVSSWFGSLASYRGAHFPVLRNTLPTGNAVIFVIGNNTPENLARLPINGAGLAIVANPANPNAKLLVVMGRNAKELTLAAQALTLGNASVSGNLVEISQLQNIPSRKPYDAPNWIPTDRPVSFGELAQLGELQVKGFTPEAIRVNFNLPPDIFAWESKGIPINLKYRHSQRPAIDKSTLNISVNEYFVNSILLDSPMSKFGKLVETVLQQEDWVVNEQQVYIPHDKVFGQNQLQFQYFFDYTKQGSCKDVFLYNERGAIDPDSSIDFSSFQHYTVLPNLSIFITDGFPYTRMADLADTAVVMPINASVPEIETYLQLMGRMGKITGYPAIRHQIISANEVEAAASKDLIVIGTAGNQPLLAKWSDNMPSLLENGSHTIKLPGLFDRIMSRWNNHDLDDRMKRASNLVTNGVSGLGTLTAFESPLQEGRSVVVFSGDTPDQIAALGNAAVDPKTMLRFNGSFALHNGNRIESFQLGSSYYVGELSWWTALRWYFAKHPLLLTCLIAVFALLMAILAYRGLRKLAAKRLAKKT